VRSARHDDKAQVKSGKYQPSGYLVAEGCLKGCSVNQPQYPWPPLGPWESLFEA